MAEFAACYMCTFCNKCGKFNKLLADKVFCCPSCKQIPPGDARLCPNCGRGLPPRTPAEPGSSQKLLNN